MVNNIPLVGKKVIAKVYDKMIKSGFSKTEAKKLAVKMASDVVNKTNTTHYIQPITINTAIVKDGFFSPQYYFDAILSSTNKDYQGHKVSKNLLKYLNDNNLIDYDGDIAHKSMRGEGSWKGLFKLVKKQFDGSKLSIRFAVNKAHNKFKDFLRINKKTPFTDLSAEFYAPKMLGNKIVFSNGLGWTLTSKGSNPDAKILNRTKK